MGCTVDLDTRTASVAGAARTSPHGLVQSYLNASDDHLWGMVSNGLKLRLLRDNHSLTRQAYLEYDLEAMFDGEIYPDFVLLYLTLHESRFEADKPEACLLEQWSQLAQEQGARALDTLRDGVEGAINTLGQGYLQHPANHALRESLRDGGLTSQDYYRQLLRIVYRLLVLFAAEDRDLLHPPDATDAARHRYKTYYSTQHLRDIADTVPGGRHPDLYEALKRVWCWLGDQGASSLALPALGGFLYSTRSTPALDECQLTNRTLLAAIRQLAFTRSDGARFPIDYRNLGSEELGSIYESLLELHPEVDATAHGFELIALAGNERKTTGSYYTPTSLITILLDSSLNPVLDKAEHSADPERALLGLKVVDPASGSGHFLLAAAQRIARRLARIRTGDSEPSPAAIRHALRDAIAQCIYGVDLNDMASELCKVALWLESLEPGKPLTFLDHHIKVGNSLIGAPPGVTISELVNQGIPEEAYRPIQGDSRTAASRARRKNTEESRGQRRLFPDATSEPVRALANELSSLTESGSDDIERLRRKETAYEEVVHGTAHRVAHCVADAWTAAFFWRLDESALLPLTTGDLRQLYLGHSLAAARSREVDALRNRHSFFHWSIEFADVFATGNKGFDVVVGNPPWERTAFEEVPFFGLRAPHIAAAPTTAARRKMIDELRERDPDLHREYEAERSLAAREEHFVSTSGLYPLSSRGRTNTYALFVDRSTAITNEHGRTGLVIPTGIAIDTPMQEYWQTLAESRRVSALVDFENRERIFPDVHRQLHFCLLTLTGSAWTEEPTYAFYLTDPVQFADHSRRIRMTRDELRTISPETLQPPLPRDRRTYELLLRGYSSGMTLGQHFTAWVGFTSSGSSQAWQLEPTSTESVPLFEPKLMHQHDHRFKTFADVNENDRARGRPRTLTSDERVHLNCEATPRYWLPSTLYEDFAARKSVSSSWSAAYRDITRATDERTVIAAIIPRAGLKQPLNGITTCNATEALWLMAYLNSIPLDFVARQKVPGTHLNVTMFHQLPLPSEAMWNQVQGVENGQQFAAQRALALAYNSWGLSQLAEEAGFTGAPFRWNEPLRYQIRCELDAFFFHVFRFARGEAEFVLDAFPITNRRDMTQHGCYRTRELILNMYDDMARCQDTGGPYESRFSGQMPPL